MRLFRLPLRVNACSGLSLIRGVANYPLSSRVLLGYTMTCSLDVKVYIFMTQIPPTKHRIGYSVLELVFQNKSHSISLILYFLCLGLDEPYLIALRVCLHSSCLITPNLHVRMKVL